MVSVVWLASCDFLVYCLKVNDFSNYSSNPASPHCLWSVMVRDPCLCICVCAHLASWAPQALSHCAHSMAIGQDTLCWCPTTITPQASINRVPPYPLLHASTHPLVDGGPEPGQPAAHQDWECLSGVLLSRRGWDVWPLHCRCWDIRRRQTLGPSHTH